MPATAILDIDGTLVDTNYHHVLAWDRALRAHGAQVPLWRIHRHMGVGGDQIVTALVDEVFEREKGDAVRAAEGELYGDLIGEVRPIPGARELIVELRDRGHRVVLASSAKEEEVDHYLDLLDAGELADAWTTSADVEATKPQPDLVAAALRGAESLSAVMVGDTPWDVIAAARADVKTIAVLTGGYGERELLDAGAVAVYPSAVELREGLDSTPLR
jgi:phosphoglycolate phosphatase-like HAD superfamily hydrolase